MKLIDLEHILLKLLLKVDIASNIKIATSEDTNT